MVFSGRRLIKRSLGSISPLMWLSVIGKSYVKCWEFDQCPSWVNISVFL